MKITREFLFAEGAYFPSCHASTVLPLDDGIVLAAYFAGERESADDVGICLSRRADGVWEAPVRIAKVSDSAHWNPVLMPIPGGVRIIFKVGRRIPQWRSWTSVSMDAGLNWTDPEPCPGFDAASGPVRSKPLYLADGSLLAPNSVETEAAWRPRIDTSFNYGESFPVTSWIPMDKAPEGASAGEHVITGKGAIQPTLWESEPGHIHALLRTTQGHIFRSDSADYGRSWCKAYNTGLPNNNSGIDIAQLDGRLYLAMNPVSGNWADRTPLVIMVSGDNGRTFAHFVTLEDIKDDPAVEAPSHNRRCSAEFSYPAIVAKDGRLHVTYTYLRRRICYRVIVP